MQPLQSTFNWRRFGGSHMRPLIPDSSVLTSLRHPTHEGRHEAWG
jgi:hypothetical protein